MKTKKEEDDKIANHDQHLCPCHDHQSDLFLFLCHDLFVPDHDPILSFSMLCLCLFPILSLDLFLDPFPILCFCLFLCLSPFLCLCLCIHVDLFPHLCHDSHDLCLDDRDEIRLESERIPNDEDLISMNRCIWTNDAEWLKIGADQRDPNAAAICSENWKMMTKEEEERNCTVWEMLAKDDRLVVLLSIDRLNGSDP